MEGLSLSEAYPMLRRNSPTTRLARSPRLPTPEASHSSNDAFDSYTHPTDARAEIPPESSGRSITSPNSPTHYGVRFESRYNQSAPHSPPYRESDAHKPSLPPLKTVLYENVSSPPPTPTTFSAPFQPSPCEPAYTATTYKPPSLYPNKKQRTGPVPDSAPSLLASPLFADRQAPQSQCHASRRFSVQHPASDPYDRRHPRGLHSGIHDPGFSHLSTLDTSIRSDALRSYGTPDATPTATAFDRELPRPGTHYAPKHGMDISGMHQVQEHHTSQFPPRRTSINDPSRRYEPSQDADRVRYPVYHRPSRLSQGPYNEVRVYEHRGYRPHPEHDLSHHPSTLHHPLQDTSQPSFFMPSQYEHQHGKARKRSNLPKQSTEIMKNWFDQNIGNPYPSEEQKAIFSQATGISMTQVSNWFINHRRRCPELRDRREKHRGNSREVEAA